MQFTVVFKSGISFKFLVFRIKQMQREKNSRFSLWGVGGSEGWLGLAFQTVDFLFCVCLS